jgi:predicted peptidase
MGSPLFFVFFVFLFKILTMKHLTIYLLLCSVTLLFSSCSDSNEPPAVPGTPEWIAGYPQVPYGATTADLVLQTDIKASVYWIVADQEISLAPHDLKAEAGTSTNAAIKFKGIVSVDGNVAKTETIAGLAENKKYFVYLVSESVADSKLQPVVQSFNFTTYYRQATSQYASAAENRSVLYLIYRPESVLKYPETKAPICFFLGGNGEVATQGTINMIRNGSLPEYISKGNNVPMIVMSIQQTVQNWNTNLIDEGVVHALATYPVDTKKVYMTGISGGGFGCWNYALGHASKLTAIVPISGGGTTGIACNLKAVPVWAFHNKTDGIVNASNSQNMITAINACPPTAEIKYSIFPDEGHDCWRRVYDQNHSDWLITGKNGIAKVDIYAWMLSKTK